MHLAVGRQSVTIRCQVPHLCVRANVRIGPRTAHRSIIEPLMRSDVVGGVAEEPSWSPMSCVPAVRGTRAFS